MNQNSFWKPRYWIWIAVLLFIWLISDGQQDLRDVRGGFPAQAGYFAGVVLAMSFLLIVFEACYRIIAWFCKPWLRKKSEEIEK